jgi:hypothetical protein
MKLLRNNLCGNERDERHKKQERSSQISPVERHGHGIAAGLAQRRCGDFYDPENERDLGNFAERIFGGSIHAHDFHYLDQSAGKVKRLRFGSNNLNLLLN